MLHELVDEPAAADPEAFLDAYRSELRAVLDRVGRDRAEAAGVDPGAVEGGEADELTVSDAAALLALDDDYPDAEAIEAESLDHLLLGMTTAVVDVETVAANVPLDVSGKGVQQRVEGRAEMTLVEYAQVHALLEERKP